MACTKASHQQIMVTASQAVLEQHATFVRLTENGEGDVLELWACKACGKLLARGHGPRKVVARVKTVDPDKENTAIEICSRCLEPRRACSCDAQMALEACSRARVALSMAARANGVLAGLVAAMLAR